MSEPEVIEHHVNSGDNFRDILAKIRASGEVYSEMRLGGITIARAAGPARDCPPHCDACCKLPGLEATKKLPHQPCRNLNQRKHKCSIYANRPPACRTFYCSWAIGNFENADRPDKIGAVAGVYEHEGQVIGSILVDSKTADWPRVYELFRKFAVSLPTVQMVVDDKTITVVTGGRIRKGRVLPRKPGDYESTPYVLEEGDTQ